MRTRSTTSEVATPVANSTLLSGGNTYTYTWLAYADSKGVFRQIDDVPAGKGQFNTCFHAEDRLEPQEAAITHTRSNGEVYSTEPYALFNRAIRAPGVGFALDYATSGHIVIGWERYASAALQSMLPSFRESNSLVNFLLELRDLKRIVEVWKKGRDVGYQVANAYLSYSFGVLPLVSDIVKIVDGLTNFRKRVRELRDGAKREQVSHFRIPIYVELPSESVVYAEGGTAYEVVRKHEWEVRPVYTATCRFAYQFPEPFDSMTKVEALLDLLGVRPDLSIVWNAIPYSFAVDWVVRVGEFLGTLSTDSVKFPVVLTDFCHSVKFVVNNELYDRDYGLQSLVAVRKVRRYYRKAGLPALQVPYLADSPLTTGELLLGASLVRTGVRI